MFNGDATAPRRKYYTAAEWKAWKSNQQWSPTRPSAHSKSAKWDEEYKTHLATIRGQQPKEVQTYKDVVTQQPDSTKKDLRADFDASADGIEKRRQAAVRIKAAKQLLATLSSAETELIAVLDAEIRAATVITRSTQQSALAVAEAEEALATAEVKHKRAQKHLETAQEQKERAEQEVERCNADLESAKKRSQRPSESSASSGLLRQRKRTMQDMAGTLDAMKQNAQYTEAGQVIVDPAGFDQLVAQLSNLATPAKEVMQPAQSMQIDIDSDPYQSFAENGYSMNEGTVAEATGADDEYSDALVGAYFSRMHQNKQVAATRQPAKFRRTNGNQFRPGNIVPLKRIAGKTRPSVTPKTKVNAVRMTPSAAATVEGPGTA